MVSILILCIRLIVMRIVKLSKNVEWVLQNFWKILKKYYQSTTCIVMSVARATIQPCHIVSFSRNIRETLIRWKELIYHTVAVPYNNLVLLVPSFRIQHHTEQNLQQPLFGWNFEHLSNEKQYSWRDEFSHLRLIPK